MIKNIEELDEHYRMLKSDLESLFKLVFAYRKPITEGDIRLASVILRKWLIEGHLGLLCNAARVKPTFIALDNTEACEALATTPEVNYFLTAGVRMNGLPVEAIYNATVPRTSEPLAPIDSLRPQVFSYKEFLRQRRLYFNGKFFTCEDLIKFTANKLGGAHLDFDRPGVFADLDKAATFMMYGGPADPQALPGPVEVYMILEPDSLEILSGIHLEIIAAATSFIHVRIGGEPVMELSVKRSWRTRFRQWLRLDKPGYGPG